jgi:hypothetical protein
MAFNKGGAASGAMGGAAAGASFGPWGAAIGGVAGGLLGGFGGGATSMDRAAAAEKRYGGVGDTGMPDYNHQYGNYSNMGRYYGNRTAPVSDQRGSQLDHGNVLRQESLGRGVGQQLVRMQAQQAADRASAQQFAAVGGARPGMQAMAARNAMLGSSLAQSAVGGQAAIGSAQMTLGAQNLYGQHLQGVRGQDEQTALQSRQLNDRAQLDAWQQRLQLAQSQQQGAISAEANRTSRYNALLGQPTQGEIMAGGLTGLGGALFGMNSRSQQPMGIAGPTTPGVGIGDVGTAQRPANAGLGGYVPGR